MAEKNGSPYLSEGDLAKRWDVTKRTLYNYRIAGSVPPYTLIGGRRKYLLADVEAYEKANRINPGGGKS